MKPISSISYRGIALATALGFLLTADAAWALRSPSDLLHSLSHDFLHHGSDAYLGVDVENASGPGVGPGAGTGAEAGAEVIAIDHDAPAAKAGLKVHDVLLQMNGQEIKDCDQLRHLLHRQPPGRAVTFLVGRDGSSIQVTVHLADRELLERQAWSHHYSVPEPAAGTPQENGAESFAASGSPGGSYFLGTGTPNPLYVGADVSPVGPQLAQYFGVSGGTGLLVESVDSESPAFRAGLQAGDIILKVNAVPMVSRNDWQKAIRSNRGKLVEVTIVRNKQERTLAMPAGATKGGG